MFTTSIPREISGSAKWIMLPLAALLFAAGNVLAEPVWRTVGIPAAARVSARPASAARWIWADAAAKKDQTVFFRVKFIAGDVSAVKFSVFLQTHVDDVLRGSYLNGKKFEPRDFRKRLIPGENVLAFNAWNSHGPAGLLFRGVYPGVDGTEQTLVSDSTVRFSLKKQEHWQETDFNDLGWVTATELGDVTIAPWSKNLNLVKAYMSPSEWTEYLRLREKAAGILPPGLEGEPDPVAKIVYRGWMPKIELNGTLIEPDFSLPIALGASPYQDSAAIKLDSLGFPITRITASDNKFWKGEGQYDFDDVDWQARRLLAIAPDAKIELFLVFNTMRAWCRAHPDDTVGYMTGPAEQKAWDDFTQRVIRPSAASHAFREEASRVIAELGRIVRSSPWGKRVIAVRLGYGIYTEWHTYGMFEGPDSGPAMTAAFRDYLKNKYGTDAALTKAWDDSSATIAGAMPPTLEERTAGAAVLDGRTHRKALDFFACNSETTADTLLLLAQETKQALAGRLVGAYYGYVFGAHCPEGANLLLDKVLASPDIDYLSNPSAYTPEMRRAGGSYTPRTIPATFHRYGKLAVCEDDMRFHHERKFGITNAYATETPEESKATVKRNYLNRIFDGIGYQALDPTGGSGIRFGAFDDPAVLEGLHEAMCETATAGDPGVRSGNDLAVVVDYRGRMKLDGRCHLNAEVRARYSATPQQLYRTGIPFDMMTLDDYLATVRSYDKVLFLNPAEADQDLMAKALTKASTSAIRLEKPLKTAEEYRDLLIGGKVRAWTAPGSYLRRHGPLLLFHTGTSGRHKIRLPEGCAGAVSITDGCTFAGPIVELETQTPYTWLFRLKGVN